MNVTQLTRKAAALWEITRDDGHWGAPIKSLKVTDSGSNRKLVCEFMLVNNTN